MSSQIRQARLGQNMTQEELAQRSGISKDIIAGLENGTVKTATADTLLQLARGLGITVKQIFLP